MYTNYSIFKPNFILSSYFLIIKFATIISKLYNKLVSISSWDIRLICLFFLLLLSPNIITCFLNSLILLFYRYDTNNEG